jgi:hypothetical protein
MHGQARSIRSVLAYLGFVATAIGQIPTCGGSGLSIVGGRFGDPWSLSLHGPPGASATLATDVVGGPVNTPFGSVCLGLTPALVTQPLTLDSTGAYGQSGLLPLAGSFASGSTLFAQAALAHPSLPGGYAFTNGAAVTFRPPRMGVFRWIGTANTFDSIDGVNDTVTVSLSVPAWQGTYPFHLPTLGWYAWRHLNDGNLYFVDDLTGANVQTIPGFAPPSLPQQTQSIVPSEDGSLLFALALGPNDDVTLKTWSRPTGTLLSTWTSSIPFFSFRGIYPIPGSSFVYLCNGNAILVIDVSSATLVTTVPLPGLLYGQLGKYGLLWQGHFYAVTTSPGLPGGISAGFLVDIATNTHTIVGGPAPLVGIDFQPLTVAAGSTGAPALWLTVLGPGGLALTQVSLSALTPSPVTFLTPGPAPVLDCVGSAGGTEMVILEGNGGKAGVVNVATGQLTPILNGATAIGVLRSGIMTKAYALGPSGVLSFPTDVVGPTTAIPLPPATATVWNTSLVSN